MAERNDTLNAIVELGSRMGTQNERRNATHAKKAARNIFLQKKRAIDNDARVNTQDTYWNARRMYRRALWKFPTLQPP